MNSSVDRCLCVCLLTHAVCLPASEGGLCKDEEKRERKKKRVRGKCVQRKSRHKSRMHHHEKERDSPPSDTGLCVEAAFGSTSSACNKGTFSRVHSNGDAG